MEYSSDRIFSPRPIFMGCCPLLNISRILVPPLPPKCFPIISASTSEISTKPGHPRYTQTSLLPVVGKRDVPTLSPPDPAPALTWLHLKPTKPLREPFLILDIT